MRGREQSSIWPSGKGLKNQERIDLGFVKAVHRSLAVVLAAALQACLMGSGEGPEQAPQDQAGSHAHTQTSETPDSYSLDALESTLLVRIDIPVAELSALVNKVVPDSIFHARDLEVRGGILGVSLDLDIVRGGEIETYTAFGSVFNRLPLNAHGRIRIPPGMWRPFEMSFLVNATTDLTLDENWQTHSMTHATITWDEEPHITIAGIRFSLKGFAEDAMHKQLVKLTPSIDRIIEEEVDLRKEVDKVWADLAEPLPLNDKPPMWLSIRPNKPSFTPPDSRGDTVVVEFQVGASVSTIVGERPPATPAGEVPPLQLLAESPTSGSYGFTAHLPVSISYSDASAFAARGLENRRFEIRDQVFAQLTNVRISSRGQRLVADVDFDVELADSGLGPSGRISFAGYPVYDSTRQVIRIDSFDYHVEWPDALTEAAAWILREGFLKETREQLSFPVGEQVRLVREQAERSIRHQELGKHVIVTGTIDNLTPGRILLEDWGLIFDVIAHGRIEARVGRLAEAVKEVPRLVD